MIKVVAAIIKRDNLYLIARRAQHKDHPGKWEFPGGKIDHGETPEEALERELLEEFNISTKTGTHLVSIQHNYTSLQIELMAYEVSILGGTFQLTDHDKIAWVRWSDMEHYELSGADFMICKQLGHKL